MELALLQRHWRQVKKIIKPPISPSIPTLVFWYIQIKGENVHLSTNHRPALYNGYKWNSWTRRRTWTRRQGLFLSFLFVNLRCIRLLTPDVVFTNMNTLSVFSCKPAHDKLHRMEVPFAVDCTGDSGDRNCQSVSHHMPGWRWHCLANYQVLAVGRAKVNIDRNIWTLIFSNRWPDNFSVISLLTLN